MSENVQRSPLSWIGLYPVLGVLIWAPLPLASNRVWAASALAMVIAGWMLAALSFRRVWCESDSCSRRYRPWVTLLCMGFYIGLLAVQLGLPRGQWGSVDPFHTRQHLLWTMTYFGAFVLVLLWVREVQGQRLLAWVIVGSGIGQALVGILLHANKAAYSVFFFEIDHAARVMGSFSYHNSLANYLLICIGLGIGLLLGEAGRTWRAVETGRQRLRWFLEFLLSSRMALRLGLAVMVIALVLTRSRMANFALPVALLVIGFPLLLRARRLRWLGAALLASVLVVDLLVVGNLVGLERVVDRLNNTAVITMDGRAEESLEARSVAAEEALKMIEERPWLGYGAGSFQVAFVRFASEEVRRFYDHAHNDYIQFAAEVGLVGFALLASIVIMTLWHALRVLVAPQTPFEGGLAFGVLIAVPAVLLQATVDFHFQIPANALTFVVVLALTWTLRWRPSRE